MRTWAAIVMVAVASAGPGAGAQQGQDDVQAFFKVYQERSAEVLKAGNHLAHIALVEDLGREYKDSPAVQDFTRQMLGTLYSFVGRGDLALAEFDALPRDPNAPRPVPPSLEGFDAVSAVTAIVEAAAGRRAVFVNEAHHVPRHRVLTMQLLAPLYAQGYRYFAAETFARTDEGLNTRGYPTRATGYYSQEPMFGALVREALRLGYTLVPYEPDNAASQDAREMGQARNLYERVFETDKQAKVLVHAGYGHISESGGLAGVPAMAERFREISGIDPLTVDQTMMTERSADAFEGPFFKQTEAAHRFSESTVFKRGDELWSVRPGIHDITVFMPRTTLVEWRPSWLASLGRKPVRIPDAACPSPRCVVFAWIESESADAVPVDALLIDPRDPPGAPRALMLPPGAYRVESRDVAGAVVHAWRETVAAPAARTPDFTALDAIALAEMKESGTPGAALAIVSGGRVIYAKGYGTRTAGIDAPVTPDSVFRMGSTTKMFTAAALVTLADQGRIAMDAPIGRVVDGLAPALAALTPHQILSQSAGLSDFASPVTSNDDDALGRNVRSWKSDVILGPPGEVYSYSSPGYWLAGFVSEHVYGKPYADTMADLLFAPLGMTRTTLRPLVAATYEFANGHDPSDAGPVVVRPIMSNTAMWPGGSMYSSASDLSRWALAMMNGGMIDGRRALAPGVVTSVPAPQFRMPGDDDVHYGYGVVTYEDRGVRIATHGGATRGYGSSIDMAPARGFAVIVLANRSGATLPKTRAAAMDLGLALSAEPEAAPKSFAPANLAELAGVYEHTPQRWEVSVENGQLVARVDNQTHRLTQAGTLTFTSDQPSAPIVFVRDKQGAVKYLFSALYAARRTR